MRSRREKLSIALALTLLVAAVGLLALGLFGPDAPSDTWHSLFGPREDGSWKALTLDGRSVEAENYLVAIRWGKVIGGYDDCNGWMYEDEKPDRNGERKVLSTLVECPEKDARRTYKILAYGPRVELLNDRELRLSRARHEGLFRRCKTDEERMRCVPL